MLVHSTCPNHADQFSENRVLCVLFGAYKTVVDARIWICFAVIQTGRDIGNFDRTLWRNREETAAHTATTHTAAAHTAAAHATAAAHTAANILILAALLAALLAAHSTAHATHTAATKSAKLFQNLNGDKRVRQFHGQRDF